ncbi:expressed unknown protein [Seminavis robusta]|uniref:Uncharacterized protein n=1 Tax=Seminavis robusta TaxID=568900 RepID=A0A9N8H533_9STRA|nr:expressed unknown protein [Seminavis robusta]|eukprot:Sro102_g051960.1 n/a (558) ;mRNA; f:35603-37276
MPYSRWVCLLGGLVVAVTVHVLLSDRVLLSGDESGTVLSDGRTPGNEAWHKDAIQGLQRLQQRKDIFELLEIQSLDEISDRGFLEKWDQCTLTTAWQRHQTLDSHNDKLNLQVVLLGGSSSARPAEACGSKKGEEDPHDGRYSNLLQSAMNRPSSFARDVTVHNMAQGSTTSIWSGLMMEQLLPRNQHNDRYQVDLIIWEHAINDHAPSADGSPHEMLRFWLTRLQHAFSQQESLPPILILYLWKQDIGYEKDAAILEGGLGHEGPILQQSLQVIQHYRQLGMSIQVAHLSKIIPSSSFIKHRREFLDDRHHPACNGSHLIADILQYAIYDNLANCDVAKAASAVLPTGTTMAPNTNNVMAYLSLPDLLSNPSTRIISFTQWQPTILINSSSSSLSLITPERLQQAQEKYLANIFPAADMPGRDDRKFAFRLPGCHTDERLQLTIHKQLLWLGVVYAGRSIAMTINDVAVPLQGNGAVVSGLASPVNLPRGGHDWIDITKFAGASSQQFLTSSKQAPSYRLSFCDTHKATQSGQGRHLKVRRVWVHQLVGVMVPSVG